MQKVGFFKASYSSIESMELSGVSRKLYTSIYFLLGDQDVSHFHRLKSDELWYFHGGDPLAVHVIDPKGEYHVYKLGLDIDKGQKPQVIVPKGSIFGSSVLEGGEFSLVGCMVSPGFEYEDFEFFTQQELLKKYPKHEHIIRKLAYEVIPTHRLP